MNSMKRQKDWTLKDELPRSLGAQYATGEEQRRMTYSPRMNEAAGPKKIQGLVFEVTGDGSPML